jgi:hypothetical protein
MIAFDGNLHFHHIPTVHNKILGGTRLFQEAARQSGIVPRVGTAMITQLLPGDPVGECITVQNYLLEKEPDEEGAKEEAHGMSRRISWRICAP